MGAKTIADSLLLTFSKRMGAVIILRREEN
ncbi:protein of unknown function [Pseudomonas sp. JV551A1]|uniref:Uncharacterized protein n=1 Tax=Pseudomonas inefficax TaxID=2078786 RepID=A0AAQ1P7I9_9PSED|nr:protein of unknown function [Pseudomonas sp. JV551A1]SPO59955.1 protein of unknown function [Pseudomonas inefficax]